MPSAPSSEDKDVLPGAQQLPGGSPRAVRHLLPLRSPQHLRPRLFSCLLGPVSPTTGASPRAPSSARPSCRLPRAPRCASSQPPLPFPPFAPGCLSLVFTRSILQLPTGQDEATAGGGFPGCPCCLCPWDPPCKSSSSFTSPMTTTRTAASLLSHRTVTRTGGRLGEQRGSVSALSTPPARRGHFGGSCPHPPVFLPLRACPRPALRPALRHLRPSLPRSLRLPMLLLLECVSSGSAASPAALGGRGSPGSAASGRCRPPAVSPGPCVPLAGSEPITAQMSLVSPRI